MKKKMSLILFLTLLFIPCLFAEGEMESIGNALLEGVATGLSVSQPQLRVKIDNTARFHEFMKAEMIFDGVRYDLKEIAGILGSGGASAYHYVNPGSSHSVTFNLTHKSSGPQTLTDVVTDNLQAGKKYTMYWFWETGQAFIDED